MVRSLIKVDLDSRSMLAIGPASSWNSITFNYNDPINDRYVVGKDILLLSLKVGRRGCTRDCLKTYHSLFSYVSTCSLFISFSFLFILLATAREPSRHVTTYHRLVRVSYSKRNGRTRNLASSDKLIHGSLSKRSLLRVMAVIRHRILSYRKQVVHDIVLQRENLIFSTI